MKNVVEATSKCQAYRLYVVIIIWPAGLVPQARTHAYATALAPYHIYMYIRVRIHVHTRIHG
jgi:hypothetical protein